MNSTETIKELEQKEKESAEILRYINNIVNNLINGDLTLTDIIAEEESLKDRCEELKETCKKIISLRQYIDFEIYGEQLERTLRK